jgi:hypothetical protein
MQLTNKCYIWPFPYNTALIFYMETCLQLHVLTAEKGEAGCHTEEFSVLSAQVILRDAFPAASWSVQLC